MHFDDLGLSEPLLRAIRATGYETPTPIQQRAIPPILRGKDLLGCAQTGTGKTAAFALPMLHRLAPKVRPEDQAKKVKAALRDGRHKKGKTPFRKVRGLVLCPTRELAQQIDDSFKTYGAESGLKTVLIFGGVNQIRQVRALQRGVDIIIATPGRLLDLLNQEVLSLGAIEIVVLDEADRMLDMGFVPDIRRILEHVPEERQSLLFSATMPRAIRELAGEFLHEPQSIKVARESSPAETVEQWVYHVKKDDRAALLRYLLGDAVRERTLIFTRTKHGADRLVRVLSREGIQSVALHSNKTQSQRTRAMESFRTGEVKLLIATDIAARGLDVDDIAVVINFDLTHEPETYIHRIGRTGRAGAKGIAISFCQPDQRGDLRAIEKLLRAKIEVAEMPDLPKPKAKPNRGKPDPAQAQPSKKAQTSKKKSGKPSNQKPKGKTKSQAKPSGRASSKTKASTKAKPKHKTKPKAKATHKGKPKPNHKGKPKSARPKHPGSNRGGDKSKRPKRRA